MQTTWNIKKLILFTGGLFLSTSISAQTDVRLGGLPTISFNYKAKNNWDFNIKYQSRHYFFQKTSLSNKRISYTYSNSDISILSGKKTGINSKIIVGFLSRITDSQLQFRLTQQFVTQKKFRNFRLAHRIAVDETFSSTDSPLFRFRYRVGSEIPLQGKKVDVNEFYFKLNTEILCLLKNSRYDIETRVTPNFGYVLSNQQKIEIGIDNRWDKLTSNSKRISSLLSITWYLSN